MALRAACKGPKLQKESETQGCQLSHHPGFHLEGERLVGFECHVAGKRVLASEKLRANTTTTAYLAEVGSGEAAGYGRGYFFTNLCVQWKHALARKDSSAES